MLQTKAATPRRFGLLVGVVQRQLERSTRYFEAGHDEMALAARTLSGELGLTGTHVFFNDGWVDYDDRQNYLLDADVGVGRLCATKAAPPVRGGPGRPG